MMKTKADATEVAKRFAMLRPYLDGEAPADESRRRCWRPASHSKAPHSADNQRQIAIKITHKELHSAVDETVQK